MDFVRWERHPRLRRPVLIAAFEGWNDAGDAASSALRFLVERWEARPFASFDPEEFYDFTVSRPQVRLDDASLRRIEWPANQFSAASVPGTGRDAIFLVGVEPQLRWRTFCGGVVDIATSLGTELAVTLGALLTDVPHTRPPRITGTTAATGLARELGMETSSYEGPTGIVGALHDALSRSTVSSASLWATVPHYVHQAPSPKATRALVERVALMLQSTVDTADLGLAAGEYEREVSERVDADPEISAYVHDLEQAYDLEHRSVPGVDNLAAEAERFLRDPRDE